MADIDPAPPPIPTPDPPSDWVFTGKALIASRTPWGTIGGGILAWVLTRYGFALDPATCNFISGIAIVLASYAMRYVTDEPITGVVRAQPVKLKRRYGRGSRI